MPPTPKRIRLLVGPAEGSSSLEALLTGRGALAPDAFRRVLQTGAITINRRRAKDGGEPLRPGDEVVAHLRERRPGPRPTALDLERLLFLDEVVVALDKPPGIAAQATATDLGAGLDAAAQRLLRAKGEQNTWIGLVHRLDLETSGVTLFARTPGIQRALAEQFRAGRVGKRYLALVAGAPAWEGRTVDLPIAPDRTRPGSFAVGPRGRPARTELLRRRLFEGSGLSAALVEAHPRTGRTHQIRVHLASVGHPLLGDKRYGGPVLLTSRTGAQVVPPRVALHASAVSFEHPRLGAMTLSAPWPADLASLERALSVACESVKPFDARDP